MVGDIEVLKATKNAKELAEWAVARRNEIKAIIRSQMLSQATSGTEKALALAALQYAEIRNLLTYGSKLGPSVEWLLKNKKRYYEAIVEGALRTSDDVTRFFSTTGWGLLL
jgi:hypothetical protein